MEEVNGIMPVKPDCCTDCITKKAFKEEYERIKSHLYDTDKAGRQKLKVEYEATCTDMLVLHVLNDIEKNKTKPELRIKTEDLRNMYVDFCKSNDYSVKSKKDVCRELEKLGIYKTRLRNSPEWTDPLWCFKLNRKDIEHKLLRRLFTDCVIKRYSPPSLLYKEL